MEKRKRRRTLYPKALSVKMTKTMREEITQEAIRRNIPDVDVVRQCVVVGMRVLRQQKPDIDNHPWG